MAEIAFHNVTKRYKDVVAVDNASFTVADNEFFCFFGPPLSGKSTILRLILGLEQPDSGEVLIDGKVVNAVSPAARNIAMVFQNLALFPHMTAADNIRFPLVERHVDPAQIAARLEDAADKLHIGHILHKMPGQLSGGERQRVAIARALVRDPAAYLMDDPISALDARLREETRVELKRIQREAGRTLIYVTHDQEEAMSVADRMAILEHGAIRQTGRPGEIYDNPASTYVARFLGSPVMNILAAKRTGTGFDLAAGTIQMDAPVGISGVAEVGLRPEDLRVSLWQGGAGVPATVAEVEPLGGYTVVTLSGGDQPLRAMLRGQPDLRVGALVHLNCDPAKAVYFGEGGMALPRWGGVTL
jgi:multiple sugar transport system ATP-binding protein